MSQEKKPLVSFTALRERLTMEQLLQHYGVLDQLTRTGHNLTGACPIHQGTHLTQFKVDTERNIWKCFGECKDGGNALDFLARMENLSVRDAALKACELFDIPLAAVQLERGKKKVTAPPANKPSATPAADESPATESDEGDNPLPPSNPPLKFALNKLQREHPYLTRERGLTLETIIDFGLGYFTGDKGLMVHRIIIPIRNVKGELVAYGGRLPSDASPEYKWPPNFKKSLELFNLDRAIKEPAELPLIIVRDFFDVFKLHQHGHRKAVALMDDVMSAEQEWLIRQHIVPASRIIVMLDEINREDIVARLATHCFVKVHVFDAPDKKPEQLTANEIKSITGGVQ